MKNLKWILFIIIIFFSCDMAILDGSFWYIDRAMVNVTFSNSDDIDAYKHDYLKYSLKSLYFAQTPNESQHRKKGECLDKCIFALGLNYEYFGKKGILYLVDTTGNGKSDHAMYSINGKMYNKASNTSNYKIIYVYKFDSVPYLASGQRK